MSPVQLWSEAPFAGIAHLAERHLAKVEVASSNLVARSIFWRHSQVVRQRTANPRFSSPSLDGASTNKAAALCGGLIVFRICSGIEAVITGLTRNQFGSNPTWVRIPPAAPTKTPLLSTKIKVGFFLVLEHFKQNTGKPRLRSGQDDCIETLFSFPAPETGQKCWCTFVRSLLCKVLRALTRRRDLNLCLIKYTIFSKK